MKEKEFSNLPESLVQILMRMGISKKLISQIARLIYQMRIKKH